MTFLFTSGAEAGATAAGAVIATLAMACLTEGAQLLGFSRISLPFLMGTMVSGRRDRAMVYGFMLYIAGGLVFSIFYALALDALRLSGAFAGAALGALHGLFLVSVFLPLLPHIHPRMATQYDGPTAARRLEPPGPFGLNYGRQTPIIAVGAQIVYGAILGIAHALATGG